MKTFLKEKRWNNMEPPFSKRTLPFQLNPYIWAIFSWPPPLSGFQKLCLNIDVMCSLCPIFQKSKLENNVCWEIMLVKKYSLVFNKTHYCVTKLMLAKNVLRCIGCIETFPPLRHILVWRLWDILPPEGIETFWAQMYSFLY